MATASLDSEKPACETGPIPQRPQRVFPTTNDAEVKDEQLFLHFTAEKSSGVIASLKPIPAERRLMLEKAVAGVMKKRDLT